MLLRPVVAVLLMVSAGPAPGPAQAASAPGVATTAGSADPELVAVLSVPGDKRPRAVVSGLYTMLASGKVSVVVGSNAKKVKLTYRTANHKKRTAAIQIGKGAGERTLPKGSNHIAAQALPTAKLRESGKVTLGSSLTAFIGNWLGHTRSLKVDVNGRAVEHINSGCCWDMITLTYTLSNVQAPSLTTANATATVQAVAVGAGWDVNYEGQPPKVGDVGTLTLRSGEVLSSITEANYCNNDAAMKGTCGA